MVACECWDRLEDATGAKLTHHIHFTKGKTETEGKEKEGLIPGRQCKPDAFIEPGMPIHLDKQTSGRKGAVYLFDGNEFHGYPPEHPKHEGKNHIGESYKQLYQDTLKQREAYKNEGYRVFAVWEHEYRQTTRARFPARILSVVREV